MSFKSSVQPLCRNCGKPLKKYTNTVTVKPEQSEYDHPSTWNTYYYGTLFTKAQCQRVSNQQVVSVQYNDLWIPTVDGGADRRKGTIRSFNTWDGETYEDEFFHSGTCAQQFAYRVCRADLASTGEWRKAREKQRENA